MTGNGCISFLVELKLPSEATPMSFAIQNQIQTVCYIHKNPDQKKLGNITAEMMSPHCCMAVHTLA